MRDANICLIADDANALTRAMPEMAQPISVIKMIPKARPVKMKMSPKANTLTLVRRAPSNVSKRLMRLTALDGPVFPKKKI